MKIRTVLAGVVVVLVAGVLVAAGWWLRRPQVITFSDDAKVTLLNVDYGKRHTPPTSAASVAPTNPPVRARGGTFTTTNDTLVVWVRQEYDAQQYHYFRYFLYDQAGVACVENLLANNPAGNRRPGNEVVGIQFSAFPRRAGKFVLCVQQSTQSGQEMADRKFTIANPDRGPFPTWAGDALPVTQEAGDLSVTLSNLVCGADSTFTRDSANPDDAVNKSVEAVFSVLQDGQPGSDWQPVLIETTDATGNRVTGICRNQWQDNILTTSYQWGLWPDEPAWKVRVQFAKQSGFSAKELWVVPNIPLEPGRRQDFKTSRRTAAPAATVAAGTNTVFTEADFNGFHVKIFPAKRFTDVPPNLRPNGGIQVQITPPLPAGMRLTIVKLTDDQGNDLRRYGTSSSMNGQSTTYGYLLGDLADVRSLNFTLALHQSRFVEFTVKPSRASEVVQ